jgi:cobalt-zinc-cadmium efflux system outer membrane protein
VFPEAHPDGQAEEEALACALTGYERMVRLLLALVVGSSIALCQVETEEIDELSVHRAIAIALEKNPEVQQMRSRIDAKAGEFWSSFGLAPPRLLFTEEGIPQSGGGFLERKWTVTQGLDFPLRSYFRASRISTERDALELRLEAEVLGLKSRVKKVYTDLLYASEVLLLREETLDLARSLEEAVQTRMEVGEAPELELMNAEIQRAEAENDVLEAERQLHRARYALFSLIGLDLEQISYGISFPDSLRYFATDFSQDSIVALLTLQPDYTSLQQSVEATSAGVREAWSTLLPDLSVSYFWQDFGRGFDYHGIELGVSVPLWFLFDQRGMIQTSQARFREASWRERERLLALKQEAENAWHGYDASLSTIKKYEEIISVRASTLSSLSLEAYRAGELDLVSLLVSQRTYLSSRIRYLDALRNYYHSLIDIERFLRTDLVFVNSNPG